jgi:hypothetical protein
MIQVKWIYLIVVLIVGCMAVYYLLVAEKSLPGTPMATAEAFMKHALKNDMEKAKLLCRSGAQGSVESVISRIRAAKPDKLAINYNRMSANPPLEGIMITFPGALIAMEMIKENDAWKITNITIN